MRTYTYKPFNLFLIITICATFFFIGCKKGLEKIEFNEWKATITNSTRVNLQEVYQSVSEKDLKKIIQSNNETEARKLMLPLANEVASYLNTKYALNISDEFANNPQGLVIYGLFFLAKEKAENKSSIISNSTEINKIELDCFMTLVSSIIGVTEAKAIWSSVIAGATEATAVAAAKLIFKRVAVCVTSVFALYQLGDCLDLW